ncbi:NC domain protein [compost metagenome]
MARYSAAASVARARSRLGEDDYRLLTNNCEHFCTWCLYGEGRSEQVRHCLMHPISGLRLAASLFAAWCKAAVEPAWRGAAA